MATTAAGVIADINAITGAGLAALRSRFLRSPQWAEARRVVFRGGAGTVAKVPPASGSNASGYAADNTAVATILRDICALNGTQAAALTVALFRNPANRRTHTRLVGGTGPTTAIIDSNS